MFSISPEFLSPQVLACVLPSAFVCVAMGAGLGYCLAQSRIPKKVEQERKRTCEALQTMLRSTDQLTADMGCHHNELLSVERSVSDIDTAGHLEAIQAALLTQISAVLESNRRMEDDLVVTRYQLEEQAQELDKTRSEARLDGLTGLHNRKSFDEAIRFAVSQFNSKGVPFALLLSDVDHFKRINDTHGHQSGDQVVSHLGQLLRDLCRSQDHVSRYGGDEFAILLMGAACEEARNAAGRIRNAIETANFDVGSEKGRVAVTVSMGLAFASAGDTVETVFERADKAMYKSKQGGRNQIHIWNNVPATPACAVASAPA